MLKVLRVTGENALDGGVEIDHARAYSLSKYIGESERDRRRYHK